MNSEILWFEYKKNPTDELEKKLVEKNINLVHYVVQNCDFLKNIDIDLRKEQLFEFGIGGLIKAVKRFDPEIDYKFEVYAIQRIKSEIIHEIKILKIKQKGK